MGMGKFLFKNSEMNIDDYICYIDYVISNIEEENIYREDLYVRQINNINANYTNYRCWQYDDSLVMFHINEIKNYLKIKKKDINLINIHYYKCLLIDNALDYFNKRLLINDNYSCLYLNIDSVKECLLMFNIFFKELKKVEENFLLHMNDLNNFNNTEKCIEDVFVKNIKECNEQKIIDVSLKLFNLFDFFSDKVNSEIILRLNYINNVIPFIIKKDLYSFLGWYFLFMNEKGNGGVSNLYVVFACNFLDIFCLGLFRIANLVLGSFYWITNNRTQKIKKEEWEHIQLVEKNITSQIML